MKPASTCGYLVFNDLRQHHDAGADGIRQLPLLIRKTMKAMSTATHWDYIYEPDAAELIDGLDSRYIESQVYQAVVENLACEHAARMIAMKNATENAGKLIDDLQLSYNNARQAAITQEIAEIVGGAQAV